MAKRLAAAILAAVLASTPAAAGEHVTNPAVKARTDAMGAIAAGAKTLGDMAKRPDAFDAAKAREALEAIAGQAGRIEALFGPREDDPGSEAREEIWASFADFTAKAEALEAVAANAAASLATADDLRAAARALGGACRDCHGAYRE